VLEYSVSIDKQNAKTFYTLGYLYAINLQQPEKALEYFKKSASLDPQLEDGYLNLGNTYTMIGDYQDALEAYRKEIIFRPNSTSAYVNMGKVYEMFGRKTEACKAYLQALEIDPSLDIAKQYLNELK
jgi:tetratricopeptide (TPR) repeat protein